MEKLLARNKEPVCSLSEEQKNDILTYFQWKNEPFSSFENSEYYEVVRTVNDKTLFLLMEIRTN